MARKVQISKEIILDAAFQMLLKEGYSAINITSLAKEIGCSTQPIAWQFGSMEGLRDALLEYALQFLKDLFSMKGTESSSIVEEIAAKYIDLAFDYPNLYKYLYMSEQDGKAMGNVIQSLRSENHTIMIQMLEKEYGVSRTQAEKYLTHMQLYVHGIASYAVMKISFPTKEEIMQMVHDANEAFIKQMKQ